MPTYPIDIEPEQIVKWFLTEQKETPSLFQFDARRAVESRDIPLRAEYHLGDEEREDLTEVETIATLEVKPAHAKDSWILKVTVEDEAGPRLSGRQSSLEAEQQIDLNAFYDHFIRPGRGIAIATALVQDAVAEQDLNKLLDSILVNRHPAMTAAG